MSKHTPGPWRVSAAPLTPDVCERWIEVFSVDPCFDVAQVTGGNLKTARANAALISAAPDLLAALEQVIDLFEWSESGGEHEAAYDSAREAITKAGGAK